MTTPKKDNTARPSTYRGWLLELASRHGKEGLKYALGLTINHAIDRDSEGVFRAFQSGRRDTFHGLVVEIMFLKNAMTDDLRHLLCTDFNWAVRYVEKLFPDIQSKCKTPPQPLPPLPIHLVRQLALDFDGEGLRFALRYFTCPHYPGDNPIGIRQPELLESFLREIDQDEAVAATVTAVLAEPEFRRFRHLYRGGSSDFGTAPILDMKR